MRYNEEENLENLDIILIWINTFNQSEIPYYSFQQVLQHNPIPNILKTIDSEYFSNLNCTEDLNYEKYLLVVEKYLENHLGKQIKRKIKFTLMQNESIVGMLQIILYISVHCKRKEQFIQKILNLPSQSQINLMNVIQESEQKIENVMQIKEVLQKVQELQIQNDYLRQQIKSENDKNNQINQKITSLMNYCHAIQKQYEQLRRQKAETLKQFNISNINQYIQLYRNLETQNLEIYKNYKNLELKYSKLEQEKNQLKSKILQDTQVINQLNTEIQRFKEVCKNLRLNTSNSFERNSLFEVQQQLEQKVLKENKSFFNVIETTKSVYFDSNKKNSFFEEDQIIKLKHQIKDLYAKYKHSCQLHQIQQKQALKAEEQINYLKRIIKGLRNQIGQLKQIHMSFKKIMK